MPEKPSNCALRLFLTTNETQVPPMHAASQMRRYQQQAILSASPEQLILKLYDIGIAACHREDRSKLRAVLVELVGALNMEAGGELAERLHVIYTYCLRESIEGDLQVVNKLLSELRETWREGVVCQKAA